MDRHIPLRPLLLIALLARVARPADAQGRVSGVARDSLAGRPLVGARVQLVPADDPARFVRSAVSDSLGRYTLGDVPDGRYLLGFFHPVLDSLGVEPPPREVQVAGGRPVRADLAIPSPARLRAAVCGERRGAAVVGTVRQATDGAPVAGATVAGEWLELSFTPQGIGRRAPRVTTTSAANGWFVLCDVPTAGALTLGASRGPDSTARVELDMPTGGFLRRELYLASAAEAGGRAGAGRLAGTVVAAADGRPIAGAQVRLVGGAEARTDERGAWVLGGAPLGTRMLEVRAVGYYPVRRSVDVVQGAPAVRVALSTVRAVLDTLRVVARLRGDADLSGFEARRRSGAGRYLTAADVMRHQPIVASDVFHHVPGLRMEYGADRLHRVLTIRGGSGPAYRCSPTVLLDGHAAGIETADDVDLWLTPERIAGIEVYSDITAPVQFTTYGDPTAQCGVIVIWTKRAARR